MCQLLSAGMLAESTSENRVRLEGERIPPGLWKTWVRTAA